jgi:hypothetical protein
MWAFGRSDLRHGDQRRRRTEHWLHGGELLHEAATLGAPMKITVARLERALKAEGLV